MHRVRDLEAVDVLDLDKQYRARDLIDVIRARSFDPYKGAYFVENGKKIYIRISLLKEEEIAVPEIGPR